MANVRTPVDTDFASSGARMAIVWGPGVLLLALTGPLGGWPRTIGWTAGLVWLGAFCLWNFARCRRVHCLFTGSFFFAMAIVALLAGLGVVSVGANTWNILSGTILVGGITLCFVPEWIWGRYWRRPER